MNLKTKNALRELKQGLHQQRKQKPAGFSNKNNGAPQHWNGLGIHFGIFENVETKFSPILFKSFFIDHQPNVCVFQELW